MIQVPRLSAIALMLLGALVQLPASARAFDLSGAWASQADMCKLVFAKKGSELVFAEMSDLYGSGFVIDGDNVKGKAAHCTIQSKKQEGDSIELSAACATTIMRQNVRFNLKVLDDNNIVRLFPEIEGMTLRYTRCNL